MKQSETRSCFSRQEGHHHSSPISALKDPGPEDSQSISLRAEVEGTPSSSGRGIVRITPFPGKSSKRAGSCQGAKRQVGQEEPRLAAGTLMSPGLVS